MGVYIAPEIKDRVAVGDDLYTITDSGGKKKLTPSPTEVSEPGTEINKALLQPMADALQEASEDLVPYNDYWWRIRQNSDFSYVSNENENFYPHSGTQDGVEYQYLGKIFDVAVKAEPYGIKTVNITSASWTDGKYTIAMPHSRYMLWWGETGYKERGGFVMVDNGKCYGTYHYYNISGTSFPEYDYFAAGTTSISMGNQPSITQIDFSTTGLTLTGSGSSALYYLPL